MKNKKIKYKCWVFWGKPTLENLCCISSINKYIDLMCIHLNESRWAWLVLFVKVFHHLMNNLFGHPFQSFQAVGARFHLPLFFSLLFDYFIFYFFFLLRFFFVFIIMTAQRRPEVSPLDGRRRAPKPCFVSLLVRIRRREPSWLSAGYKPRKETRWLSNNCPFR